MASLSYDQRSGQWRVWYASGLRRRSEVVARMPKGSPKGKYPPAEALARKAELEAIEADSRSNRARGPDRTLAEFLADDLERFEAMGHRKNSIKRLDRVGLLLLRFAATRRIVALSAFGPDDARLFLEWRATTFGVAHSTLAMERAYLSGAWGRGVDRKEVKANVWAGLGGRKLPVKAKEPKRPSWSVEEFETLLNWSRPWLRRVLIFGTRTGLRIGELVAADRSWIQRDRKGVPIAIVVPAEVAKSKKSRRVPLHEDARAIVLEPGPDRDCTRILQRQKGGPITKTTTEKAIREACIRAGLEPVGSHSLRRSFGRWAIQGIGPFATPARIKHVSVILGHASTRTTEIYLSVDESGVDDWMSGPGG